MGDWYENYYFIRFVCVFVGTLNIKSFILFLLFFSRVFLTDAVAASVAIDAFTLDNIRPLIVFQSMYPQYNRTNNFLMNGV